jgi:ribosome-associated heat shock protein Hsp15
MISVRVDKYLFAIRIYKTRSIAAESCKNGRIIVNKTEAKASRMVQQGDEIVIKYPGFCKTIIITELLEKRVSASLVKNYCTDITPQEELKKQQLRNTDKSEFRPTGLGRPTKKDRRIIDKFKER